MYINFDVKPEVRFTGGSKQFTDRQYYFLSVPAIQFVTRGFLWENITLGSTYDANVSDDKPAIFTAANEPPIAVTKITLRKPVESTEVKPVPLSRLLLQLHADSMGGVFVRLSDTDKEKLQNISPYFSEAIRVLISKS